VERILKLQQLEVSVAEDPFGSSSGSSIIICCIDL
jgi:hypothetical protein